MPLVMDATTLRDIARGLRSIAQQQRHDADRLAHHSLSSSLLAMAERNERRARKLDEFANRGLVFELRRRC